MRFFPEEGYKRIFVILFYILLSVALLYGVFRYLLPALLPFLIALPAAVLLRRPTLALSVHTKMPRRIISALLAIVFVSAFLLAIGFAAWKLIDEIGDFARAVISGENALLENLQALFLRIGNALSTLPFSLGKDSEALRDTVMETMLDMAKNAAVSLGTKLPELAGKFAAAIPQVVLFFVITVLSAVYFCADYEMLYAFFHSHISEKGLRLWQKLRAIVGNTLVKVLKSYAILFLMTFAELFFGFVILRESYAFLLALATALVDSLPVFGIGTILLPMALYHFFTGEAHTAIGFCILYAVVTVIRQIMEPKILGAGIGVHPLFMLISMYAGLKLFGIVGMIFLPLFGVITKNILCSFPKKESSHEP